MQPRGDRKVLLTKLPEHWIGWLVTIVLCLVPVIMWLQLHPLNTIAGFPSIMLAVGRVTGLVGMIMYALNLVYSTRLKFLERWFGGLNRVYIAHHLLGGLALVMLSLHPFTLALRYVQVSMKQAALLLLPNGLTPISALFKTGTAEHLIVLEQWAVFLGIVAFWGMVGLLLVTFFIKIPYRLWLFTHKFLGAAFFLAGLHVLFVTSDTSKNGALKYYILLMSLIGILAFIYRTLMGSILIRKYRYKVDRVQVVAGNVTHMYMSSAEKLLSFKPGQFVFVRFLNGKQDKINREWHPFSISSAPGDGSLRLSVKGLGDYTNNLVAIRPGTTAEIEGAYGRFTYTNFKNMNQIWIAGGIGITPFLSMAASLPNDGYKIDLYYSVKTESEVIDWNKLYDTAMSRSGNFRVIPYVGDKQKGFLNADYIEQTSGGLTGKDFFICGPPPMMKSMRDQLKKKHIPRSAIHSEEFAMS
ncbi:MAG: ferredoxin reductase family protein [Candidatus Saccharimonadales bacterium]